MSVEHDARGRFRQKGIYPLEKVMRVTKLEHTVILKARKMGLKPQELLQKVSDHDRDKH